MIIVDGIYLYPHTMADNAHTWNVETASDYIVSTCQLFPKSFSDVCDHMHRPNITTLVSNEIAAKEYSITCGSTAEFYICPLKTCEDDIDILVSSTDCLAFSGDFPELPNDVSGLPDIVKCYKIESYQGYPSFVRLRFFTEMVYDWKHKRFKFDRKDEKNSYMYVTPNRPISKFANIDIPDTQKICMPSNIVSPIFGPLIGHKN